MRIEIPAPQMVSDRTIYVAAGRRPVRSRIPADRDSNCDGDRRADCYADRDSDSDGARTRHGDFYTVTAAVTLKIAPEEARSQDFPPSKSGRRR